MKQLLIKTMLTMRFYGGLVPENLDKLKELADAGVLAFKCFLSDITSDIPGDFTNVDDYTLYKGMQKLAELDQILMYPC